MGESSEEEINVALAYSFGVESKWIRELLRDKGISPLLIICKGYLDWGKHPNKWEIRHLLKDENYIIIPRIYMERWFIREDWKPHRFSLGGNKRYRADYVFTNTILKWALEQKARPFDTLYLGRKITDLREEMELPNLLFFKPPTEAFGFKLKFPFWNWTRKDMCLLPIPAIKPEQAPDMDTVPMRFVVEDF